MIKNPTARRDHVSALMELMVIMAIIAILVTPFLYLEIFYAERHRSTMAY